MTNEERVIEVHSRINKLSEAVSKLYGGLAVVAFLALAIGGMVAYHINYRFENIEKTLDKIEKQVSNKAKKCPPTTITLVSP